jgi:hypothetical protein
LQLWKKDGTDCMHMGPIFKWLLPMPPPAENERACFEFVSEGSSL